MNRTAEQRDSEILYGVDGTVATITLSRPDRMNTISGTMLSQLAAALKEADEDAGVRAVILTGAGRAFCAGLDLGGQMSVEKTDTNITSSAGSSPTLDISSSPPMVLHEMDTPTVCALNGAAAGYGMDLALGCDIRLMADTAKLAAAYTKRGVLPESGGTWILPRLIGWSKAAEIVFTGRTLGADECAELGLVSRVIPGDQLMADAQTLADEIAANAPLAVQASKRMMRMGLSEQFPDHIHHVFLQLLPLLRSKDCREGMMSFLEKRKPVFTGR